jgi:Phage tail lysozyme
MASNQATIGAFLAGKGLSAAQVAGVEGNLYVESGFDPTNVNPKEGAIGIAQWEGSRRTALRSYAARTGGSESSLTTQLGFMWNELTGSESSSLSRLRATTTPGDAAAVFDQYYERSSGEARATRIKKAQQFFGGASAGGSNSGGSSGDVSTDHTGSAQQAGLLGGAGDVVGGIIGDATGAVAGAVGDAVISPVVEAAKPLVFKGLAVVVAGGLVALGVYKMFAPTVRSASEKVAGAAGSAAKLAALA